jgi:hypothetical protein
MLEEKELVLWCFALQGKQINLGPEKYIKRFAENDSDSMKSQY